MFYSIVHVYTLYMDQIFHWQVVELLLAKGANFEHRNVSDYTPLSLAASGGYVNIIKLLLRAGADINSRWFILCITWSYSTTCILTVTFKGLIAHTIGCVIDTCTYSSYSSIEGLLFS